MVDIERHAAPSPSGLHTFRVDEHDRDAIMSQRSARRLAAALLTAAFAAIAGWVEIDGSVPGDRGALVGALVMIGRVVSGVGARVSLVGWVW